MRQDQPVPMSGLRHRTPENRQAAFPPLRKFDLTHDGQESCVEILRKTALRNIKRCP